MLIFLEGKAWLANVRTLPFVLISGEVCREEPENVRRF
jgi:hypothetical protein